VPESGLRAFPLDADGVVDLIPLVAAEAVPVLFVAMQPALGPEFVEEYGGDADASEEAERDLVLLVDELARRRGSVLGVPGP
jgi:hypothetical protein